MRNTLVALAVRIVATALVAAAATPAYAQTERLIVDVPFEFLVGSEHLPAGQYVVQPMQDDPAVLMIESADGKHSAVTLTIPGGDKIAPELWTTTPRLTFATRGDEHVLARILELDGTERDIAGIHVSSESTLVVSNAQAL